MITELAAQWALTAVFAAAGLAAALPRHVRAGSARPAEQVSNVGLLPGARAVGSAAQDVDLDATSGEENGTIAAWWS